MPPCLRLRAKNLINSSHKYLLSVSYVLNIVLGAGLQPQIGKVSISWGLHFRGTSIWKGHDHSVLCKVFTKSHIPTSLKENNRSISRVTALFQMQAEAAHLLKEVPSTQPMKSVTSSSHTHNTSEFTCCSGLHPLFRAPQLHLHIDKLGSPSPLYRIKKWRLRDRKGQVQIQMAS